MGASRRSPRAAGQIDSAFVDRHPSRVRRFAGSIFRNNTGQDVPLGQRYLHLPRIFTEVLSILQLLPTSRLRRRIAFSSTGRSLMVQRRTVERSTVIPTLGHHFLAMTQAKRIRNVPTHAGQDHFEGIVQPIVQPLKHACHIRIQCLHSSPTHHFRSRLILERLIAAIPVHSGAAFVFMASGIVAQ